MAAKIAESCATAPTRLRGARARARRLPDVQRRPLPVRRQLRLAPAAGDQGQDPHARHPQLAPAVDRADRHHQPRLRRQRLQRHRAAVLLDLHAQEAHGRRHAQGIPRRGPRVAAVPPPGRRGREAARVLRDRAGDLRAQAHKGDGGRGRAVHRHQHLQDGERARGLSVRRIRGPLPRGVEGGPQGPRDLPAEHRARRGAVARQPAKTPAQQPSSCRRTEPPPRRSRRCPRRCSRACAGRAAPSCPTATPRGPT